MLRARAIRAALVLGFARSWALLTDAHKEQMTAATSIRDPKENDGHGTLREPEGLWKSEEAEKGLAGPVIAMISGVRPLIGRFSCDLPCTISARRADRLKADAVVMNACGPDFPDSPPGPAERPEGQKLVLNYDFERANAPSCLKNQKKLAGIDWTMTYHPDSDILRPLFSMEPRRAEHTDVQSEWLKSRIKSSAVPNANEIDWAQGRDKLVLWFVSNCNGERMALWAALQHYLPPGQIDMFGGCGKPFPCPGRNEMDECHQNLFRRYKFYAAFENTRCNGYLTEKWARGMVHGLVPLVYGGKSRGDYENIGLPRDSFIHWDDYNNPQQLANALRQIGSNKTKYGLFHRWRATHRVVTDDENNHRSLCKLCGKLLDKNASQPHKSNNLATISCD